MASFEWVSKPYKVRSGWHLRVFPVRAHDQRECTAPTPVHTDCRRAPSMVLAACIPFVSMEL